MLPHRGPEFAGGEGTEGEEEEERGGREKEIKKKKENGEGEGEKKKRGNKLWFRSNETRQFNWTFPSDAFVITNLSELFHAVNTRFVMLSFFFLPPSPLFSTNPSPFHPRPLQFFGCAAIIKISTIFHA